MKMSIGEMAKLNNISVQTLRYYDKIGLLKPTEVDPNSNYRYYDENASDIIWKIKLLKSAGLSLDEIKENIDGDLKATENILKHIRENLKRKIERLNTSVAFIDDQVKKYEKLRKGDLIREPEVKYFHERVGYLIEVNYKTNLYDTIKAIIEFEKEQDIVSTEVNFNPTRLISINKERKPILKSYLALERAEKNDAITHKDNEQTQYTLRAGEYAVLDKVGVSEKLEKIYVRIFEFVRSIDREIDGEAVEVLSISRGISSNKEECLTQIQVLLK